MKRTVSLIVLFALLFPFAALAQNESLNVAGKRVKLVAKSAVYGTGGGLVVGLASQVFKKKTKNIFVFGSLGLYAGILLGVYIVSTSHGTTPYDGPDTYEDYGDFSQLKPVKSQALLAQEAKSQDAVSMNLLNLSF